MQIESKVVQETFDVFQVEQLTRSTTLQNLVAVDQVEIAARQSSQIHRHVKSDTVLYIVDGAGEVVVGEQTFAVRPGDRIHIPPGAYHGVRTGESSLKFISVQSPPILNDATQVLDLEVLSN